MKGYSVKAVKLNLEIVSVSFHRNGVCGTSFHCVSFDYFEELNGKGLRLIATVFPEAGSIAVIDPTNPDNTWRGDYFEDAIRKYLAERK